MKQMQTRRGLVAFLLALLPAGLFPDEAGLKAEERSVPQGLTTVCIDPGHGGKDPGCHTKDLKYKEKDIVLSIGKKLRDRIHTGCPDVKVVMTRSSDVFVPLAERPRIANSRNAQLFISIHVNALPLKSRQARSVNGFSVHILGQSSHRNRDLFRENMELCRRENSVIYLEEDYSATYEGFNPADPESYILFNLMQNANLENSLIFAGEVDHELAGGPIRHSRGISQDPFWVLWKTKMPSVLVETGFITHSGDLKALGSDRGQAEIAEGLFRAFLRFKERYDRSLDISAAGGKTGAGQAGVGQTASSGKTSSAQTASGQTASSGKSGTAGTAASGKSGAGQTGARQVASSGKSGSAQTASGQTASSGKSGTAGTGVSGNPTSDGEVRYGVQVAALSKKLPPGDPFFRGQPNEVFFIGRLYKYVLCPTGSLPQARENQKKLKKYFPDSFLVKIDGNGVSRVR